MNPEISEQAFEQAIKCGLLEFDTQPRRRETVIQIIGE